MSRSPPPPAKPALPLPGADATEVASRGAAARAWAGGLTVTVSESACRRPAAGPGRKWFRVGHRPGARVVAATALPAAARTRATRLRSKPRRATRTVRRTRATVGVGVESCRETCSSFRPGRRWRSRFRLQAVSRIRIWIQNLECLQAKCTLWLFQCALMGGDMDQLALWTERKIGQAVI